jgi:hypothetical protein
MKKTLYSLIILAVAVSCGVGTHDHDHDHDDSTTLSEVSVHAPMAYFGSEITEDGAVDITTIQEQLGEADSVRVKVTGTVAKVCQVKGCWMTMYYNDEGESMRVSFKDYGFFVPKNIDGKEAIIDGYAYIETTSMEDLKHYAEDAGESEEEIAEITESKTELTFVADGVIVKDYEVEVGSAEGDELNHDEHDHSGHDH